MSKLNDWLVDPGVNDAFAGSLLDQRPPFAPIKKNLPRCSQPESRCSQRPTTRPIDSLGVRKRIIKKTSAPRGARLWGLCCLGYWLLSSLGLVVVLRVVHSSGSSSALPTQLAEKQACLFHFSTFSKIRKSEGTQTRF